MVRQARFLCVVGVRAQGVSSPAWPGQDDPELADETWFAWRLLGRNNREIGRSPRAHAHRADCHRALADLCARGSELAPALIRDSRTGQWGWRLDLDGLSAVVSSRRYYRQRECRFAIKQFLASFHEAAFPEATPDGSRCMFGCGVDHRSRASAPEVS